MRTVRVKAINLRAGDVIDGRRIKARHKHPMRGGLQGVVVIAPQPGGYGLGSMSFTGEQIVQIKRPKYNMKG